MKKVIKELNSDLPDTFCPAPFRAISYQYHGGFGPCPYLPGVFEIKDQVEDRWNGGSYAKLREEFLAGKKPEICQRCWSEEDHGMVSRRQLEIDSAPKFIENFREEPWQKGPAHIIVRPSNLCNLACKTCRANESSKYHKEGAYYLEEYSEKSIYYSRLGMSSIKPETFELIVRNSKNLERVEFYGGEPILDKSHHVLLEKLNECGDAENIELYYCTNATQKPSQEKLRLWKNFKSLEFIFSLDGVEDEFHYIRWPGEWSRVESNLLYYNEKLPLEINRPIRSGVNVTVSILNIFYLDKIFSKLRQFVPLENIFVTLCSDPDYYSIVNLPENIKSVLNNQYISSDYNTQLQPVLNFMNSKNMQQASYDSFIKWTERTDKYRNISIRKFLPELANYLHL